LKNRVYSAAGEDKAALKEQVKTLQENAEAEFDAEIRRELEEI
jgi:hypothetical protein